MAFLNVNTPLKNLKTGDYFYPLTNLDQIITGSNRLSAFMSEDNNLLNLSNIGNINNGTANRATYYNANGIINSANSIFMTSDSLGVNRTDTASVNLIYNLANTQSTIATKFSVSGMSYFNGTIVCECNQRAIEFRQGNASYNSYIYYATSGNEALNFVNRQSVTSFIFWTGNSVNGSAQWYQNESAAARTDNPALQIKANCVYINKLLPNTTDPSYNLYVNGITYFNGNTTHNGVVYFANGTSYFINNSAVGYLADFRAEKTRLVSNWLGFYASANAGGNRYGYIQTNNTRMYFRKENGDSNSAGATFDFNGPIYTNGHGIYAQHGHIMTVGGNEVNFIPDGYNSSFWFNYETFNRKNNGTISEYLMGNGKHGYANLRANKVYNAIWNDFAEYREGDITEPGRVVAVTQQSNKVNKTTIRLQPCAHIISDTFGCSVGQSDTAKTPVGVAGRVLVYPYQDISNYKIGDCLCAAPNGTADIMTREEIISYPDRIIGIVDEIPTYEYWNQSLTTNKEGDAEFKIETKVKVNGRIWVYVR